MQGAFISFLLMESRITMPSITTCTTFICYLHGLSFCSFVLYLSEHLETNFLKEILKYVSFFSNRKSLSCKVAH